MKAKTMMVVALGGMLTVDGYAFKDLNRNDSLDGYEDADGHIYDFAYGLNWQGIINDERVRKYGR